MTERRTTATDTLGFRHEWVRTLAGSYECDCLITSPVKRDGLCPNKVADLLADMADAERELAAARAVVEQHGHSIACIDAAFQGEDACNCGEFAWFNVRLPGELSDALAMVGAFVGHTDEATHAKVMDVYAKTRSGVVSSQTELCIEKESLIRQLAEARKLVKEAFYMGYARGYDRANWIKPKSRNVNEAWTESEVKLTLDALTTQSTPEKP